MVMSSLGMRYPRSWAVAEGRASGKIGRPGKWHQYRSILRFDHLRFILFIYPPYLVILRRFKPLRSKDTNSSFQARDDEVFHPIRTVHLQGRTHSRAER